MKVYNIAYVTPKVDSWSDWYSTDINYNLCISVELIDKNVIPFY